MIPPELFFRLWPAVFVRVLAAEHFEEGGLRILGPDNCVEPVSENYRTRELPVSTVAVTEAKRTFAGYVPEQDIRLSENRHGVEEVERLGSRQVTLTDVSGKAPMLSPLDIDRHLRLGPWGVKDLSVPIGPEIGRGVSRVVAYP